MTSSSSYSLSPLSVTSVFPLLITTPLSEVLHSRATLRSTEYDKCTVGRKTVTGTVQYNHVSSFGSKLTTSIDDIAPDSII